MKRLMTVLLLAAACGPAVSGNEEGNAYRAPRLCIENAAAGYGSITARAGMVRYHVMSGQTQCKALTSTSSVALRASTIGGGAAGPRTYAATLQPGAYPCWRWRLTDSPSSSADLGPCPSNLRDQAEGATVPSGSAGGA
ncbi:MAG TPA: hypothetical protein VGX50_13165 [Longimicrobium sp.]|nr:hypothetical protein [Longimicrobium sp.]